MSNRRVTTQSIVPTALNGNAPHPPYATTRTPTYAISLTRYTNGQRAGSSHFVVRVTGTRVTRYAA